MTNHFTIHHLGFDAVTREKVIEKYTTDLARELFADGKRDVLILIMDGTYIYLGMRALPQYIVTVQVRGYLAAAPH